MTSEKGSLLPLNVFVTDNLSIRDYYVSFAAADEAGGLAADLPDVYRIGGAVEVDAYNADEFMQTLPVTGLTLKAFRALQGTTAADATPANQPAGIASILTEITVSNA